MSWGFALGGVGMVTPLHVYLQAICSPLSFLRLPILKRETCLVFNVNFLNSNQHNSVITDVLLISSSTLIQDKTLVLFYFKFSFY